jgi:cytochrome c oxidase assembly factor CtaG/putative copper export protein
VASPATRRPVTRQGPPWLTAVPVVAVALLVALAAGLVAGYESGATSPWLIVDPGPLVRWGIIATRIVVDLTAALTVGLLVMAAVGFPSPDGRKAFRPALAAAAGTATVWAAAELALLQLTYSDISGLSLRDSRFGPQFVSFAVDVDLGRGIAFTAILAAFVGLAAAAADSLRAAGLLALLAIVALVPSALAGHVAGSSDHETAVTALGLHLLGVAVWVGGLAALLVMLPGLSTKGSAAAARRFSTLAGWAFAAVALSGLLSGWLRLGRWAGLVDGLWTSYGVIMILKATVLVALGVAGWWHRQRTLEGLAAGRPHSFARLATAEVALMGAAVGLGAALARTAPPAATTGEARPVTPAESVTGYPLPPAPDIGRLLTSWHVDLLWVIVAGLGLAWYLVGVRRLVARGDGWPAGRAVCWVLGLALLVYVTCGGPAVYGRVTFSGHMVMHMLLAMVVPPLLVLGAPVTLALRTLTPRSDGTRGPREWLQAVLTSPVLRLLTFPPVAAVIFTGSLVVFYWTDLFELALTTHVGHELMTLHFLLAGYLFAWVLIGVDPGPHRPGYPLRLVLLFATMAFHAFVGVAMISGTTVLQPQYFGGLGRDWGRDLLADQRFGGQLAWAIGEIPTLVIALVLVVQWARSDDREARRSDRAADRDGDAELTAYNEMLARLAARDRR